MSRLTLADCFDPTGERFGIPTHPWRCAPGCAPAAAAPSAAGTPGRRIHDPAHTRSLCDLCLS